MDHKQVIADIETGEYDGRLAEIIGAARQRITEAGNSVRWRITIGDETWTQDTVTMGEERLVEAHTGVNWDQLAPLRSAEVTTAYIAAHWHKIGGLSWKDALDKADQLSVKEAIGAVTEDEVPKADPKDQEPPTT